jgi:AAHS family 4-hydroxybenzoate transporter-like MFS transporter
MFTGSTIGGVVTGLVAAKFVSVFGWQILFWIAGVGPILLAAALIFLLPESIHYLTTHDRHRAELVKVVRRLEPSIEIDNETVLTAARHESKDRRKTLALFAGRLAVLTPLLWVANLLSMVVFYFASSWLPTILATSSIGASGAAVATSLYLLGGTIGGLAIMRPLDRFGFLPIAVLFFCGIPALIAVGVAGLSAPVLLAVIIMAGFCIYGLQFGLIAMEGPLYPPPIRGRGLGFCFAAARVGASIGPFVGGVLIGQNLDTQTLFIIFSAPLAVGGVVAAIITPLYRKQVNEVAHTLASQRAPDVRAAVAAR